jgi:alpha-L-fucosidase 2
MQITPKAKNGRVEIDEKKLHIVDAETVTLHLAATTSFQKRDPKAACAKTLHATKPYDELLARHITDHHSLYRRVRLDLGSTERDERATNERLAAVRAKAVDPNLAATYFQYKRYLLIASSRPNTQPANLQNLWNDDVSPA